MIIEKPVWVTHGTPKKRKFEQRHNEAVVVIKQQTSGFVTLSVLCVCVDGWGVVC